MKSRYIGLGEDSNFASFHPIVTFVYFCVVVLISMFSMSPVFLVLSFFTGFGYSCDFRRLEIHSV